ncbi:hypothetical protein [uncultured Pantoea sp.]|uniref:hypothetical protein n=1 Tax=uncultured Pantoea sp. TaxID=218084 RepID=UPI002804708F|nr:hypothetical protein [uncultured Pantoea sp.]
MKQMSDSSREKFEEFMAERFEHCIDRRRCKNGDGNDYMSWDMNVARIVWQHLSQRAEAAEASAKDWRNKAMNQCARREVAESKLAELEKQEPVKVSYEMALAFHKALSDGGIGQDDLEEIKTGLEAAFCNITHPAPAINLAELVPEEKPDLPDNHSDTEWRGICDGWNACRAAILRKIEEAQ